MELELLSNVDTFMNTSGVDGVYTLHDTSNCTPSKLLTHRVYATVCTNGALYNYTNREVLMSVVNLTERPLDLYYVFSPPVCIVLGVLVSLALVVCSCYCWKSRHRPKQASSHSSGTATPNIRLSMTNSSTFSSQEEISFTP